MKASHLKHAVFTGIAYNTRDNTNLADDLGTSSTCPGIVSNKPVA